MSAQLVLTKLLENAPGKILLLTVERNQRIDKKEEWWGEMQVVERQIGGVVSKYMCDISRFFNICVI